MYFFSESNDDCIGKLCSVGGFHSLTLDNNSFTVATLHLAYAHTH